jgi:hypothetical protein
MQPKSLFAFALMLAAAPTAFACTVTVNEADDDEEGDAAVNASDDTADEGSDPDDPSTDPSDTDEPSAPEQDGGSVDPGTEPTADSGVAPQPTEGDGPGDGGGDPTSPDAEDAATDDATDDENTDADGGPDEATDDPTEQGDAAAPVGGTFKTGTISLSQQSLVVLDQEIVTAAAGAGFSIVTQGSAPPAGGNLPCESETVGSCTLQVCDLTDTDNNPDPSPGTIVQVSAGDIGVTGLSQEITLSSDDSGNYAPMTGMVKFWEGGETVTASAAGSDDVPEFSIELVAPSAVSWTSPELSIAAATTISRGSAFEAAWTEGAEGTITVMLSDAASDDVSRSVTCVLAVSEGGVTIDEALLSGFSDEGFMSASVATSATKTVEDWSMTIAASGTIATGQVAFTD